MFLSLRMGLLLAALAAAALLGCAEKASNGEQPAKAAVEPVPAHGSDSGSSLKFTAPPEWVVETPSSSMRRAQYRLPRVAGDPEDAEMVVFYFGGQGGSVQANIDRWIGQFTKADGSPALDVAKISRRKEGTPLTIVDVSGTYASTTGPMMTASKAKPDFRMLAAVAESSSGPWFFKLTGPAKTVAKWEASFHAFLKTIK